MTGKVVKEKTGRKKRNPNSVMRRNARERDRIKTVNDAFDHLREHVPNGEVQKGRKISKVETLKSAIEYIRALRTVLGDEIEPMENFENMENFFESSEKSLENSGSEFGDLNSPETPESGIGSNETSLNYDAGSPPHSQPVPSRFPTAQKCPNRPQSPTFQPIPTEIPESIGYDSFEFNPLLMNFDQSAMPDFPHHHFNF